MTSISIKSNHPIVFLYDVENSNVVIPEYHKDMPVSANDTSTSIITRHYVDGVTSINMDSKIENPIGELVFECSIQTPSGCLSLNTTEVEDILSIKVNTVYALIKIWMDDIKYPENISIQVISKDK